jgi:hypothetical protein
MSRSDPPQLPSSKPLPLQSFAAAADRFVAEVRAQAPCRVEAKVASPEGMPLLCVVETVFQAALPRRTAQELVWLGAPASGAHRLQLQAFGPGNRLLAEATHEFDQRLGPVP